MMLLAQPPAADAEVSAACWAHLSDKKTHTTPAADRRFHLQRGEPSPCTEYDAEQSGHRDGERRSESRSDGNTTRSESNARDNRRKDSPGYHCKLTWRGLRCG